MTQEEKHVIVGEAAAHYQAAKIELAFIQAKLVSVGDGFEQAGDCIAAWLRDTSGSAEPPTEFVLSKVNKEAFVGLLGELEKARIDVAAAAARLNALGITCLS